MTHLQTFNTTKNKLTPQSEQVRNELVFEIAQRDLVGTSQTFRKVLEEVKLLASVDATVLLTGETGTGKDICARAIHYTGSRCSRPFIPINCGAVPNELFENELFGHVRGAYTDARGAYSGLIREAEGGTIFFDDIEALGLSSQAKLLRFLEGNEYTPLGSGRPMKANVRIIAASNEDLRKKVREGTFREDVYFRLNVLSIQLPPLRERVEDIVHLAKHFIDRYGASYCKNATTLSDAAIRKLEQCAWPGNVRELENVIHRSVIHCSGCVLTEDDIPIEDICTHPASPHLLPFKEAKEAIVSRFEQDYVSRLLCSCHGNISKAAARAGKHRRAFWELMRKHNISRTG